MRMAVVTGIRDVLLDLRKRTLEHLFHRANLVIKL